MPRVNFNGIDENGGGTDYVPPGKYFAEISEVKSRISNNSGEEMWWLQLKILTGPYEGYIVSDNLFFHNRKVLQRVKLVYKRAKVEGKDLNGETDLVLEDIKGRTVIIKVQDDVRFQSNGDKRSVIAFDGYEEVTQEAIEKLEEIDKERSAETEDDMPLRKTG